MGRVAGSDHVTLRARGMRWPLALGRPGRAIMTRWSTPLSRTSATSRSESGAEVTDPAVQAIREVLRSRTDVRLAVVFGSRARGTATPASDVDVGVHAPGIDLLALASDLSRGTGLEVDVVALDDVGVTLLARIVQRSEEHTCEPQSLRHLVC